MHFGSSLASGLADPGSLIGHASSDGAIDAVRSRDATTVGNSSYRPPIALPWLGAALLSLGSAPSHPSPLPACQYNRRHPVAALNPWETFPHGIRTARLSILLPISLPSLSPSIRLRTDGPASIPDTRRPPIYLLGPWNNGGQREERDERCFRCPPPGA